MIDSFKGEGQAEWDGRQNFMMRLHNAILHAHNSMINNDYLAWYKALTILRIELSSHLRTEEEKTKIKKAMKKMKHSLYNIEGLDKMEGFIEAQEELHAIMRKRGFDVPINERDPGHSLR